MVANGGTERSDGKDAVNGVNGAPQQANGVDGSNHVTATVGKGVLANGVARVEVELLDGSAKDVKVLGVQGADALAVFCLVVHFLQGVCYWGRAHAAPAGMVLKHSNEIPARLCTVTV